MERTKAVRYLFAAISVGIVSASSTFAEVSGSPFPEVRADLYQLSLEGPPAWLDAAATTETHAATGPSSTSEIFHKETWDLELSAAYMSPLRSPRDYFNSASTAFGYFVTDNFSVNAAVVGYSVNQPDNDATAGGFDLYARYYFLNLGHFTFFGDIGVGVFLADKKVPEGGTNFDFTPRSGVGVGYHLFENVYLLGGARFFHLSNAAIRGQDHNPGYDSLQYFGSIMFTF